MEHYHSPLAGRVEKAFEDRGYGTANWAKFSDNPEKGLTEVAEFRRLPKCSEAPEIKIWLRQKSLWRIEVRNYVYVGIEFRGNKVCIREPQVLSVSSSEVRAALQMCIEVGFDLQLGQSGSNHERLELLLMFRDGIDREFWPPFMEQQTGVALTL